MRIRFEGCMPVLRPRRLNWCPSMNTVHSEPTLETGRARHMTSMPKTNLLRQQTRLCLKHSLKSWLPGASARNLRSFRKMTDSASFYAGTAADLGRWSLLTPQNIGCWQGCGERFGLLSEVLTSRPVRMGNVKASSWCAAALCVSDKKNQRR